MHLQGVHVQENTVTSDMVSSQQYPRCNAPLKPARVMQHEYTPPSELHSGCCGHLAAPAMCTAVSGAWRPAEAALLTTWYPRATLPPSLAGCCNE